MGKSYKGRIFEKFDPCDQDREGRGDPSDNRTLKKQPFKVDRRADRDLTEPPPMLAILKETQHATPK
ncbi:MAG: hypothetical protein ABI045_06135 [Flavobacteriales bacterium]